MAMVMAMVMRVCCRSQVAGDNYGSTHKKKRNSGGSGGWQWRRRVDQQLQISGPLISREEKIKIKGAEQGAVIGDWSAMMGPPSSPPAPVAWVGGGENKRRAEQRLSGTTEGLVVLL